MNKFARHSAGDKVFVVLNTVFLVIVTFIVLYPLILVVSSSLSDPLEVLKGRVWLWPVKFNINSYKLVFRDSSILSGYKNTIMYTVAGTAVNLAMTIAAAYPLSRKDFRGRWAITSFFVFTMFFSGGLIPTYLIIQKLGMINSFWVMVVPAAVSMWNVIIMRTFFQSSVPVELQEAAFIDGCTNIATLLKVVLPLSKPIIAVMVLFYGVNHWNEFFSALVYITSRSKYPLQLILRDILIQNQMSEQMLLDADTLAKKQMAAEGIKYAVIIVANLPVLMLYPFLQRYFVKGVMIGAIKG